MPKWVENESSLTLTVDLIKDNDFIVPDEDSDVILKVCNKAGTQLYTETVAASGSQVTFNIPDFVNTLTGINTVESRFVSVVCFVDGGELKLTQSYQLSAFIPFTVNADSVRTYLGLASDELEDEEIDLFQAYHTLVATYGADFTTPFNAEGATSYKANKALALQAALDLALSLPQRIAQKTDAEKASFQRSSKFDPYKLIQQLKEDLSDTLAEVLPDTLTIVGSALFAVSVGTDPFTGA